MLLLLVVVHSGGTLDRETEIVLHPSWRERDLVGIVLGFPKSEGVIVQTKLAMPHVGIPRDLDLERCILGVC